MADKTTENERIYTIPLRDVKSSPRNHRADRAIRHIKSYLAKHMKSEDIWIDASVNEAIWGRGMYVVPRRIRVRARRFEDGVVEVSLPEVESKSIREDLKKRKEKGDEKADKKSEKKDEAEKKDGEGKKEEKPAAKEGEAEKKEKASPPEGAGEKPKPASKPPASQKSESPAPKATQAPKEASGTPPAKKQEGGKEKSS